jgi:c-di-AMP phosphodiesterase-like protein
MIGTIKEVMDMFNNTYTDHKQTIWVNWITQEEVEDAHGDAITEKQYDRILKDLERNGDDDVQHQINEALYQIDSPVDSGDEDD